MGKEDYKNEKKGHGFLCVPKELLFDNRYKQLTIEAILLYAYMLDRLKLSIENGWKDSDGKVFIYFSLESIMDLLKCSKGKAISTLKELDAVTAKQKKILKAFGMNEGNITYRAGEISNTLKKSNIQKERR